MFLFLRSMFPQTTCLLPIKRPKYLATGSHQDLLFVHKKMKASKIKKRAKTKL